MDSAENGNGHGPNLCGARRHQDGGSPCKKPAGWGTDHVGVGCCRLHGGSTDSHRLHAAGQLAQRAIRRLGVRLDGREPQQQLLAMVYEAAGNVSVLREMVAQLSPLDEDPVEHEGIDPGTALYGRVKGDSLEAKPHVLVSMYDRERDRLVSYSAEAIKAGIAERQVQLAEEQASLVARVIMGLLDDPELGLDFGQRELGRRLAGRHLRQLAPGTAEVA